ncbi:hypothetical protein Vadar_008132 [Vaccinium darrowii]|uniref:Uncharacterized protein n=1 Tax=Vaccinium darrowii TaxID=229202 RepID=A0ACB7YM46_9ERIC|nr:hypothetical protein Vadar_008132 [Vaccinium darrowii]
MLYSLSTVRLVKKFPIKQIETFADHSLKYLLFKLSRINPETTHRFLRVSELKPEDVIEILLGFEFVYEKFEIEVEKVKSLWGVFKWANSQVTKKKDITDFYFNLSKNVAFGAQEAETRKSEKQQKEAIVSTSEGRPQLTKSSLESAELRKGLRDEASRMPEDRFEPIKAEPIPDASAQDVAGQPLEDQPRRDHHHKRNEDAVAAAKERFLARKRVKEH